VGDVGRVWFEPKPSSPKIWLADILIAYRQKRKMIAECWQGK
jgi:hypothetical protein